eukprot:CAMPEP_0173219842 /NCGR_PEP_ID=MMETSP1142-20121109/1816_1 /TAXON_ID=483371 /ORGANISM="non described non described, Strain CCMP2298" /LENGTH=93 /DNA_ID=CAMNT_0014147659 /DNA_START=575 /DNA_END=856 /DNA_ORIENTATION=-
MNLALSTLSATSVSSPSWSWAMLYLDRTRLLNPNLNPHPKPNHGVEVLFIVVWRVGLGCSTAASSGLWRSSPPCLAERRLRNSSDWAEFRDWD